MLLCVAYVPYIPTAWAWSNDLFQQLFFMLLKASMISASLNCILERII